MVVMVKNHHKDQISKTSRKKDPKGGKAPPSKKKEGYGGGKAKKKWSKDKVEALQEGHKLHDLVPQPMYHYQPTEYLTEPYKVNIDQELMGDVSHCLGYELAKLNVFDPDDPVDEG
uniref:40S ribosomal protein S25 n=1 Tax=Caenorhabditis japonica TaxID=281687 RepID=A0A8R1HTA3_CAEJA